MAEHDEQQSRGEERDAPQPERDTPEEVQRRGEGTSPGHDLDEQEVYEERSER
jgi:hypothetical protein